MLTSFLKVKNKSYFLVKKDFFIFSSKIQSKVHRLLKTFANSEAATRSVLLEKPALKSLTKFTGKHLCQSLFFDKVTGLRSAALFKKRPWHRFFPVNFAKFLRTPFLYRTPLDDCFCELLKLANFQQKFQKCLKFSNYKSFWCNINRKGIFFIGVGFDSRKP